jgi:hypothetical protein
MPRGLCLIQMSNLLLSALAHVLTWMFVIGMAGCVVVIPITAYRLFSVLFSPDLPDEINPVRIHPPVSAS